MSRIFWIDLAKIIGLFLVIFAHLYTSEGTDKSNVIRTFIYGFHMPFFFLISGFLAKKRDEGILFSLRKNIFSLLIPFFTFNVFFAIYYGLTTDSSIPSQFHRLLKGLYTAQGTPCKASWFVICLFYIKCIFDIAVQKPLLKYIFPTAIVISCLPFHLPTKLFIGQTILGFIFYTFGFYLKKYFPKNLSLKLSIGLTPICFLLSCLATLLNGKISMISATMNNPALFYASTLSGSFGIIFISYSFKNIIQDNKVIAAASTASIGVVLLHMVFVDLVKDFRSTLVLDKPILFAFYAFFSILIYAICVLLFSISMKKAPLIWGKR